MSTLRRERRALLNRLKNGIASTHWVPSDSEVLRSIVLGFDELIFRLEQLVDLMEVVFPARVSQQPRAGHMDFKIEVGYHRSTEGLDTMLAAGSETFPSQNSRSK